MTEPWIEACADIALGLAIIGAVAAVFVVGPLLAQTRRARRASRRYVCGEPAPVNVRWGVTSRGDRGVGHGPGPRNGGDDASA